MAIDMRKEPSNEDKVWIIERIARFIRDGGGSFRTLCFDYLNMGYEDCWLAGGMKISNTICDFEAAEMWITLHTYLLDHAEDHLMAQQILDMMDDLSSKWCE